MILGKSLDGLLALLVSGLLVFALPGSVLAVEADQQKAVVVDYIPAGNLPFSEVVRVDNMLYLSGQIGFDESAGGLVEGGVKAETRQVLTNIQRVLEQQGSSMNQVIRCLVMLTDMGQFAAMNNEYRSFFKQNLPARSTMGVSALALGASVEIECTALAN